MSSRKAAPRNSGLLSVEATAILRAVRVCEPTFSNMIGAELFDHRMGRGRFKVLKGLAGLLVYDPARELGNRTVGEFATEEEALGAATWCSNEADRKGEENLPEVHGWRLDWGKAATWQPER